MGVANTLAYYYLATITAVKSFILQALRQSSCLATNITLDLKTYHGQTLQLIFVGASLIATTKKFYKIGTESKIRLREFDFFLSIFSFTEKDEMK